MNKRLFGGLIVAGALTLWSSVGVLAEDSEGLRGPGSDSAKAALAYLATSQDCNPSLSSFTSLVANSKDPQKAQALLNGLQEHVAQLKANANEQILTALDRYQELFSESRDGENEDGAVRTTPQLPDFMKIATDACSQIPALVTATQAAITALPAPTVARDTERDDEADTERDTKTTTATHERD
jgi:hypothetical protein